MTFGKWIDHQGSGKIAKKLGITRRTVDYWREGHCVPNTAHVLLIQNWTRNKVTHREIIAHYQKMQG